MLELLLLPLGCLLGGFEATDLLLRYCPKLNFLPLLGTALLWYLSWQVYSTPTSFFNMSGLSAGFYSLLGAMILPGWGFALARHRRRRK